MQVVNCFVEEWEEEAKLKWDAVSEAKILKKYSGLEWIDIDNDVLCHVGDTLNWNGKQQHGWNICGLTENWSESDPN